MIAVGDPSMFAGRYKATRVLLVFTLTFVCAGRLFDEILTSLVVYFDHVRWLRARHVLASESAEEAELQAEKLAAQAAAEKLKEEAEKADR